MITPLYTFIVLDARKGTDQFSPEEWARILGIEVTVRTLASACADNIDPQHGQHFEAVVSGRPAWPTVEAGDAAISFASRIQTDALPSAGSIFATVRPDVDSIGAMAVLVLRRLGLLGRGASLDQNEAAKARISFIAERDDFVPGAAWAPRPLPTVANPWGCRWNVVTLDGEGRPTPLSGYILGAGRARFEGLPTESAARELIPQCVAEHNAVTQHDRLRDPHLLNAADFRVEPQQGVAPVSETQSLAPLGVICSPFRGQAELPLAERVAVMACWLLWGDRSWPSDATEHASAVFAACGILPTEPEFAEHGEAFARERAGFALMEAAETASATRFALARAVEIGEVKIRVMLDGPPVGGSYYDGDGNIITLAEYEAEHSYTGRPARVAVVESAHVGAMGLGYCVAPVVAMMPAEPVTACTCPEGSDSISSPLAEDHPAACALGARGAGYPQLAPVARKVTIAAWRPGLVDFAALKAALNAAEVGERALLGSRGKYHTASENACAAEVAANGWGGGATILGSPQGDGTVLTLDEIARVVRGALVRP